MNVKIMDIYPDDNQQIKNVWEMGLLGYEVKSKDKKITMTVVVSDAQKIMPEWQEQIVNENGVFKNNQKYAKKD